VVRLGRNVVFDAGERMPRDDECEIDALPAQRVARRPSQLLPDRGRIVAPDAIILEVNARVRRRVLIGVKRKPGAL
jgi:hypothetical protein